MHISGLWRVRAYVRPYAGSMAAMVVAAFAGLFAATSVPLVTKALIDGPVARHDTSEVWPLALLALGLGVFEGGMAMLRRFVLANTATGMETDIRNDLYAHLQRLPIAFHDRWQSGQLLSRAMSDPASSAASSASASSSSSSTSSRSSPWSCLLLQLHVLPRLDRGRLGHPDLLAVGPVRAQLRRGLAPGPGPAGRPHHADRGGRRGHPRHQGLRPAPARRSTVRRPAPASSTTRAWTKVYLRARFWSVLGLIPNLTLAVVLLAGALAVGHGELTLGGLVAFVSLR